MSKKAPKQALDDSYRLLALHLFTFHHEYIYRHVYVSIISMISPTHPVFIAVWHFEFLCFRKVACRGYVYESLRVFCGLNVSKFTHRRMILFSCYETGIFWYVSRTS